MTDVVATNNAATVLASGIAAGDLALTVATGTGARFPTTASQHFYVTLIDSDGTMEIVKVTNRAADVFTIVRGQDGTAAQAFVAGDRVELRPVAAIIADLVAAIAAKEDPGNHHDAAAIIAMLGYTPVDTGGAVGITGLTITGNAQRSIEGPDGTGAGIDIISGTGAKLQFFSGTYTGALVGVARFILSGGGNSSTFTMKPDGTLTWNPNAAGDKNVWHSGNLTNLNQLTNGPGYVTAATAPVTSVAGKTGAVTLAATDITSATMATARLGSGTANTAAFLRGDSTWSNRIVSKLEFGDANFYMNLGANPEIYFAATDAIIYNRGLDQYEFYTGGVQRAVITTGGRIYAAAATYPFGSTTAVTDGAGAAAGTLTNAPTAGNPTKWLSFDDAGTIRYIPAW